MEIKSEILCMLPTIYTNHQSRVFYCTSQRVNILLGILHFFLLKYPSTRVHGYYIMNEYTHVTYYLRTLAGEPTGTTMILLVHMLACECNPGFWKRQKNPIS